jgi:hypothetical protein
MRLQPETHRHLYADLDPQAQQGALDRSPELLERRFALLDESVDAVLCWDVFTTSFRRRQAFSPES